MASAAGAVRAGNGEALSRDVRRRLVRVVLITCRQLEDRDVCGTHVVLADVVPVLPERGATRIDHQSSRRRIRPGRLRDAVRIIDETVSRLRRVRTQVGPREAATAPLQAFRYRDLALGGHLPR